MGKLFQARHNLEGMSRSERIKWHSKRVHLEERVQKILGRLVSAYTKEQVKKRLLKLRLEKQRIEDELLLLSNEEFIKLLEDFDSIKKRMKFCLSSKAYSVYLLDEEESRKLQNKLAEEELLLREEGKRIELRIRQMCFDGFVDPDSYLSGREILYGT